MMSIRVLALSIAVDLASGGIAAADGNAKRGGELYRACVACHSLEPRVHLTGPSLANVWGITAGKVVDFVRYSLGLKQADFKWDEVTLNAWLAAPQTMMPGTTMVFRGIENDADRADVIAFLKIAMAAGGDKTVIETGLVPADYVRGQQPEPLAAAPDNARVTNIRHCADAFVITTADGTETIHWEKNVRLKVDSQATGPAPGAPVILGSGMIGDRFSVIFSSVDDLKTLVDEKC